MFYLSLSVWTDYFTQKISLDNILKVTYELQLKLPMVLQLVNLLTTVDDCGCVTFDVLVFMKECFNSCRKFQLHLILHGLPASLTGQQVFYTSVGGAARGHHRIPLDNKYQGKSRRIGGGRERKREHQEKKRKIDCPYLPLWTGRTGYWTWQVFQCCKNVDSYILPFAEGSFTNITLIGMVFKLFILNHFLHLNMYHLVDRVEGCTNICFCRPQPVKLDI